MEHILLVCVGVVLAGIGGDWFVRGAIGLATVLRVPAGIIGATVAAFATSTPEMAVGINAAIAGTPQVAAGDALGSNVVNIGLVLGMTLLLAPLRVERRDVRRDLPLTITAPLLLGLLAFDGRLSRLDGAVLVSVFAAWLATAVLQAAKDRDRTAEVVGEQSRAKAAALTFGGIVVLLLAGRSIVIAAGGFAAFFGLDAFLVGATLVAFGTSVPELSTAILARARGHDALSAGTIMGSNIFNSLWIVGVVAILRPFPLRIDQAGLAVIVGATAALLMIPSRSWSLERWRGVVLLIGYGVYIAVLIGSAS